jgi:hypothetical protein
MSQKTEEETGALRTKPVPYAGPTNPVVINIYHEKRVFMVK